MTYILGIESSCDETAAAVVTDGRTVLSNVIATEGFHPPDGSGSPSVNSNNLVFITLFFLIWPFLNQITLDLSIVWGVRC